MGQAGSDDHGASEAQAGPSGELLGGRPLYPVRDGSGEPIEIFPIEWFRRRCADYFLGKQAVRTFRSSGTTERLRATSLFSDEGTVLYRQEAIERFRQALAQQYGWDLTKTRGLSLIPTTGEWPDSSLAQMVAWLGDVVPVRYIDANQLSEALSAAQGPTWVFATAFHWVNAIDETPPFALPDDVVLIETGGTKGRSRSVTPEQLRAELKRHYQIPEQKILSEYGMSELACQAYDIGEQRRFRFGDHVEVRVLDEQETLRAAGVGLLTIKDPRRVDYPYWFRTQDIVELRDDRSFVIRGRHKQAPLKGCSLAVEELQGSAQDLVFTSEQPTSSGIDRWHERWSSFFKSETWRDAVVSEFGSQFGPPSLEVSQHWLPDTPSALHDAIHASQLSANDRWLMIAPSTHGIAVLEALVLATAAGVPICVRLPRYRLPTLEAAVTYARTWNACSTVDFSFRIADGFPHANVKVLAFGSSDTIHELEHCLPRRVAGHGSVLSVAICDATAHDFDLLLRDVSILAGRGCLNPNFVLTDDADTFFQVAKDSLRTTDDAALLWGFHFDSVEMFPFAVPMNRARVPRLFRMRGQDPQIPASPLSLVVTGKHETFVKTAETRATIVVTCKDPIEALGLVQIGYDELVFRQLGSSQSSSWTGVHLTKPLFSID